MMTLDRTTPLELHVVRRLPETEPSSMEELLASNRTLTVEHILDPKQPLYPGLTVNVRSTLTQPIHYVGPHYKLRTVYEDHNDGFYLGARQHNGEFSWWPFAQLWVEAGEYYMVLGVVSPPLARRTYGNLFVKVPKAKWRSTQWRRECQTLVEEGVYAQVLDIRGRNRATMHREATAWLGALVHLFGTFMDAHQNRLGATGFDVLAGNFTGSQPR